MNTLITADFSQFGIRELIFAQRLIKAYTEEGADFLNSGITINFNTHSGYVFLSDDDYNVGVLDEEETHIVQFFSCPECGYEGTQHDAISEGKDFNTNDGFCSKECADKNKY
ncbi:MAG TPA: hypothetical protein VMR41_06490 [Patescibacteria group bacterium]|nr:hypothetical protein [Patescibacteria group bacterium]